MRQHLGWGAAALVAGVIGLSADAGAASISLNETTTTVDDCELSSGNGGGWDNLTAYSTGVLGFKGMFTLLPPTSGSDVIVIDSATLTFQTNAGTDLGNEDYNVYRMITPWMTKAAGASQNNVSLANSDVAGGVPWAAGSFSSADYDVSSMVVGSITDFSYDGLSNPPVNVTGIVSAMYSTGVNQGFALFYEAFLRSQERVAADGLPKLDITYHYAAVPEPASLGLVALGGLGLLARRRR